MKRFALLATLLSAVVVAGCGGGGASTSSTQSKGPSLAENSQAESQEHKRKEQAREPARGERREEKEDREFKEHEEARIRREEAQRKQKEKADRKVSKPKPEATPERSSSEVDPIAAEELRRFTGVDRENWEIAYEVCGSTPEEQLAREFHTEDNWSAIGHAYGSEEYREPFSIAPEEGCMAALKVSNAQWEATLEGLPFKEL
jgi:hypothetical protein